MGKLVNEKGETKEFKDADDYVALPAAEYGALVKSAKEGWRRAQLCP